MPRQPGLSARTATSQTFDIYVKDSSDMNIVEQELNDLYDLALTRKHPACQECSRNIKASEIVLPRSCTEHFGARKSGILFIGQDPGGSEGGAARTKKLCATCNYDKSAKKFLSLSSSINVPRVYWYFTNAVWHGIYGKNEKPSEKDRKCCRHLLSQQIDILQPKVIVAIGEMAQKSSTEILVGGRVILPSFDELHESSFIVEINGTMIAYLYHPAFGAPNYAKRGLSEVSVWQSVAAEINRAFKGFFT